jgi:hypothetical protein
LKTATLLLAFVAWLGLYAALACLSDPFILFAGILAVSFWISLPALALGLVLVGYDRVARRSLRPFLLILLGFFVLLATCWLAVPANRYLIHRDELAAQAFPDQIHPLLEAYHASHGSYPSSLQLLPDVPPLPRLLRPPFGYSSEGSTYQFSFPKPGDLIDIWEYNSESHAWHLAS